MARKLKHSEKLLQVAELLFEAGEEDLSTLELFRYVQQDDFEQSLRQGRDSRGHFIKQVQGEAL